MNEFLLMGTKFQSIIFPSNYTIQLPVTGKEQKSYDNEFHQRNVLEAFAAMQKQIFDNDTELNLCNYFYSILGWSYLGQMSHFLSHELRSFVKDVLFCVTACLLGPAARSLYLKKV